MLFTFFCISDGSTWVALLNVWLSYVYSLFLIILSIHKWILDVCKDDLESSCFFIFISRCRLLKDVNLFCLRQDNILQISFLMYFTSYLRNYLCFSFFMLCYMNVRNSMLIIRKLRKTEYLDYIIARWLLINWQNKKNKFSLCDNLQEIAGFCWRKLTFYQFASQLRNSGKRLLLIALYLLSSKKIEKWNFFNPYIIFCSSRVHRFFFLNVMSFDDLRAFPWSLVLNVRSNIQVLVDQQSLICPVNLEDADLRVKR